MKYGSPSLIITFLAWKSLYMNAVVSSDVRSSLIASKSSCRRISSNSRPVAFRKQYLK